MIYHNRNHFHKNNIPSGFKLLDDCNGLLEVVSAMFVDKSGDLAALMKTASAARQRGKKFFKFKGKNFPSKIDPETASTLLKDIQKK